MREIKFRVWGKGKMNYIIGDRCLHLYSDGTGAIVGKKWSSETKKDEDYTFSCFNDEDTYEDKKNPKYGDGIIMEFTGLKDKKHKKKIYEGDIVLHQNGYLYIVKWDEINACWYLRQPRKKDGNVLEEVYTGGINGQDIWRCEVIGNVYENPELLELK